MTGRRRGVGEVSVVFWPTASGPVSASRLARTIRQKRQTRIGVESDKLCFVYGKRAIGTNLQFDAMLFLEATRTWTLIRFRSARMLMSLA